MLRDECGVKSSKWLPYGYMMVPIAADPDEAIEIGGPVAARNRSAPPAVVLVQRILGRLRPRRQHAGFA